MASVMGPQPHLGQASPSSLNMPQILSQGTIESSLQFQELGAGRRGHGSGIEVVIRSNDPTAVAKTSSIQVSGSEPFPARGLAANLHRKRDGKEQQGNADGESRPDGAAAPGVTTASNSPGAGILGICPSDDCGAKRVGSVQKLHLPPSEDAEGDSSGAGTPTLRQAHRPRLHSASGSSSSSSSSTQPALSHSLLPPFLPTANTTFLRPCLSCTRGTATDHTAPASCNRSRAYTFQLPVPIPKSRPAPANERPVSFPNFSSAQEKPTTLDPAGVSDSPSDPRSRCNFPQTTLLPVNCSKGAGTTGTATTTITCASASVPTSTALRLVAAGSAVGASGENGKPISLDETSPPKQRSRQRRHHDHYQHDYDTNSKPAAIVASSSDTPAKANPSAAPLSRPGGDEKRSSKRPPVSFKPPLVPSSLGSTSPGSGRAVIPPIRAFRSSGSRRSLVLDMNPRNSKSYEHGDESSDSNHRDRTLRALEGRDTDEPSLHHPRASIRDRIPQGEDGGDMFLRMAREEFARKSSDEAHEGSTVSRMTRASHGRRPYSAAIPSYQQTSPPRISRRLSDQQETKRSRAYGDERSLTSMGRAPSYRETIDRLTSAPEHGKSKGSAMSTPATPRALTFQDDITESPPNAYTRRRGSASDQNGPLARPSYKSSSLSYSKTYNSSPLVPRAEGGDIGHGFEGTESTASTNPPSAMWDEVDKMKSQIERIQKKGVRPPNSAISRGSDERPPTATTTVTTMSTSPKRTSGIPTQAAETNSSTASPYTPKELHPILKAALSRTRPAVSIEVFRALEVAVNDSVALTSMMGSVGQPGPVSSSASSIGHSTNVTDRQLRRKADSICRSLTELCIALSDGTRSKRPPVIQTTEPVDHGDDIKSPTATTVLATPPTRRPSAVEMQNSSSPRNASRLEERRANMVASGADPSPRFQAGLQPDYIPAGRKSSLLVARARRVGADEIEEGRRSSLLRTRRAGTEEPDDGRKSSLFVRSRRNTIGDEEEGSRMRAPSRSNTIELSTQTAVSDPSPPASALPRRRLAPSAMATSRLAAPVSTPSTGRRYFERMTTDREAAMMVDRSGEERGQRHSIRAPGLLIRSGSLPRRNRESMLPSVAASSPAPQGYR